MSEFAEIDRLCQEVAERDARIHDRDRRIAALEAEVERLGDSYDCVQKERKNLLNLKATDINLTVSEWMLRTANAEAEVERLRGLLAEALPELDEHDAEYKYVTKSGLKERMREACAQSGEGER